MSNDVDLREVLDVVDLHLCLSTFIELQIEHLEWSIAQEVLHVLDLVLWTEELVIFFAIHMSSPGLLCMSSFSNLLSLLIIVIIIVIMTSPLHQLIYGDGLLLILLVHEQCWSFKLVTHLVLLLLSVENVLDFIIDCFI